MRAHLLRILVGLVVAYAALCGVVYVAQRSLLFHPGPPPRLDPGDVGLAWRDAPLETADGERLGAWLVEVAEPRGCVLVSHGNAGSIENRLHLARALAELGWSTLLYDYRGYGTSSGSPTEAGTYADGEAALAWLRAHGFPDERIVLWGESLGGGVATELASRCACAGLVLDHTFTSAVDAAERFYGWLPVDLLAKDRYDNRAKLGALSLPILIVHSPADGVIPYAHAEVLHAAAHDAVLLTTEGGHDDGGFMLRERYTEAVRAFLERCTEGA